MTELLLYGLIAGLLSLVGGLFVLWNTKFVMKFMTPLISFAAGAFMAVGFLDVIPEAVELVEEPHYVFVAVLIGFTAFFTLERFLMKYTHHHHDAGHQHDDHTESLPTLVMVGDSLHNILDGILIALAYAANPLLGLPTALSIAAHEVPQEIGDFAILLDRGWSRMKIFWFNVFTSLLTLAGVAIGYYAVTFFEGSLPYLLGGAGGIFIYIAASDLIPELHHRAHHKYLYRIIGGFVLGLVVVGYLIFKTHAE